MRPAQRAARAVQNALPAALLRTALSRHAAPGRRRAAVAALLAFWTAEYARYRGVGRARTARERDVLATANWEAFTRHYNERVPTIEEEFELWGDFHQHRHEMRYDLVAAAVRRWCPEGGRVLDVGCGSALVADRLADAALRYIGLDFPHHHIAYARKKHEHGAVPTSWVRGDGERLPLADATVDVVVLSEVIEHLLRPERAVWEVARVLRPGGVLVMTTNNASEVPLRSPLSHLFAWAEKAAGFHRPELISLRPWVWPEPVDPALLPPGSPAMFLPHTHHIQAETRALFASVGLRTFEAWTFEFPPPQAATTAWLERRGEAGKRVVDSIEAVARRVPLVNRLGCHLLMLARREATALPAEPPGGVWPGPFSR